MNEYEMGSRGHKISIILIIYLYIVKTFCFLPVTTTDLHK